MSVKVMNHLSNPALLTSFHSDDSIRISEDAVLVVDSFTSISTGITRPGISDN